MAPGVNLQEKEMWDDSALIHTWDRALAEYKKYHSLQAQGKKLEDLVTAEEYAELKK
jgi:hypothetical protein